MPVSDEASSTPGVDNVGVYEIADAPLSSSKAATAKVVDPAMKSSDIVDQLQRLHD